MKKVMSTSHLLSLAAVHLKLNTNAMSGNHLTIDKAIVNAGEEFKFRKEVIARAIKLANAYYGVDNGDVKIKDKNNNFGKTYSATRGEHAKRNVLKARDARWVALVNLSSISGNHHSLWYPK